MPTEGGTENDDPEQAGDGPEVTVVVGFLREGGQQPRPELWDDHTYDEDEELGHAFDGDDDQDDDQDLGFDEEDQDEEDHGPGDHDWDDGNADEQDDPFGDSEYEDDDDRRDDRS